MECPKVNTRHSVVVARMTQVEKPKQVLVNKVKPEEAAVGSGFTAHGEVKIRRVPQCGQNMPGSRDREQQGDARHRTKLAPILFCEEYVEEAGCDGKQGGDKPLEQETGADARPHQ